MYYFVKSILVDWCCFFLGFVSGARPWSPGLSSSQKHKPLVLFHVWWVKVSEFAHGVGHSLFYAFRGRTEVLHVEISAAKEDGVEIYFSFVLF